MFGEIAEAPFASPQAVKLEKLFFLTHGAKNSIKEIKGADSVARLLTCSFPPYWDRQGMAFVLKLLADLSGQIPCQELTFTPEISIVDFLNTIPT